MYTYFEFDIDGGFPFSEYIHEKSDIYSWDIGRNIGSLLHSLDKCILLSNRRQSSQWNILKWNASRYTNSIHDALYF